MMLQRIISVVLSGALGLLFLGVATLAENPMVSEAQAAGGVLKYKPNQLIVQFRRGVKEKTKDEYLTRIGAQRLRHLAFIDADLIRVSDKRSVDSWRQVVSSSPLVKYAEPNYQVSGNATKKKKSSKKKTGKSSKNKSKGSTNRAASVPETPLPNDPLLKNLWGLHNTGQTGGTRGADMDAPKAWENYAPTDVVVVAVIDSGVDYNHADLARNMWINRGEDLDKNGIITSKDRNGKDDDGNGYVDDFRGWDWANWDNNPMDDYGHGTHVAGTIAAVANNNYGVTGLAGDGSVVIIPLKFLDAWGDGYTSDAIEALAYAHEMGAKIANNSWGGSPYNRSMLQAIQRYNNAGGVFVAAAGNFRSNMDSKVNYPASYKTDNMIAVAATTSTDTLASFSNYGRTSVHVAAPGSGIYSTVPGNKFAYYSGTSMAAPHVSGVVAMLRSVNPYLSPSDIRAVLMGSSRKTKSLEGKVASGGVVNADSALKTVGTASN